MCHPSGCLDIFNSTLAGETSLSSLQGGIAVFRFGLATRASDRAWFASCGIPASAQTSAWGAMDVLLWGDRQTICISLYDLAIADCMSLLTTPEQTERIDSPSP